MVSVPMFPPVWLVMVKLRRSKFLFWCKNCDFQNIWWKCDTCMRLLIYDIYVRTLVAGGRSFNCFIFWHITLFHDIMNHRRGEKICYKWNIQSYLIETISKHIFVFPGESSSMAGVGDLPPSMSQSMTGEMMTGMSGTVNSSNNMMSQSMMAPSSSSPLSDNNDLMTTSTSSLNFKSGKKYIPNRSK